MAIQTLPADDEHPADTIAQVFQKGYKLHDRILRPAMVVVYQLVRKLDKICPKRNKTMKKVKNSSVFAIVSEANQRRYSSPWRYLRKL